MHQRQAARPQREEHRLAHGALAHGGDDQHQRRDAHRPAAHQRALGDHQVGDDVGKAQVEVRLIGRRLVIAGEYLLNLLKVVPAREIEIVQKAQAAVEEEQQRRRHDGQTPVAQDLPRQKHVARVGQRHEQRAREDDGHAQIHAQQHHRRAEGICQVRVVECRAVEQVVRRRKLHVPHGGDERQVHAQIAVGGLAAPGGAVRRRHEHVRVLQIRGERGQRQHDGRHGRKHLLVVLRHAPDRPVVAKANARAADGQQQRRRGAMRREREAPYVCAQRRQHHFQEHAQGQAQKNPRKRAFSGQLHADDRHAAQQKQKGIQYRRHGFLLITLPVRSGSAEDCSAFCGGAAPLRRPFPPLSPVHPHPSPQDAAAPPSCSARAPSAARPPWRASGR